jgi:hypothetical protein
VHAAICSFANNFTKTKLNIFDDLPALSAPKNNELSDELARYLSTDPEQVKDVLLWWHEHKSTFPGLSRMALDYLTIPGEYSTSYVPSKILTRVPQPHQQTLNEFLARVEYYCLIFETGCLFRQLVPSCV